MNTKNVRIPSIDVWLETQKYSLFFFLEIPRSYYIYSSRSRCGSREEAQMCWPKVRYVSMNALVARVVSPKSRMRFSREKKNGKEKAISDPGDLLLEALAFTLFEWLSTLSLPCSRDSVRTTKVRYHSATELIRICMPRLGRSQNAWAVGESNGSREEKFEEKFL